MSEAAPLFANGRTDGQHVPWLQEIKWIMQNSIPPMLVLLLSSCFRIITVFTVGHLGSTELVASSTANMIATMSAWCVMTGTVSALDVLCSAKSRLGQGRPIDSHIYGALMMTTALCIPIAVLWYNSMPVLTWFKVDGAVAILTARYLRIMLLGLPAQAALVVLQRYMLVKSMMRLTVHVLMIAVPLHMLFNYLLVLDAQFGLDGAALASVITAWCSLLLLVTSYMWSTGTKLRWQLPSLDHTRESSLVFARVAIPGLFLTCGQWWLYELASGAAYYLGVKELAAHTILVTITSVGRAVFAGLSMTTTVRVSQMLNDPHRPTAETYRFIAVSCACTAGMACILFVGLYSVHTTYGRLYTLDAAILQRVCQILPLCANLLFADGLSAVAQGALRGVGQPYWALLIYLPAMYIVAPAVAYMLAFHTDASLMGLWLGIGTGSILTAIGTLSMLYLFYRRNPPVTSEKGTCRNGYTFVS